MPPRPRTRSATKKTDSSAPSEGKAARKSGSSGSASLYAQLQAVNLLTYTYRRMVKRPLGNPLVPQVEKLSTCLSSSRKRNELVEGTIEELGRPITVKGSPSKRGRRINDISFQDDVEHSDAASHAADDSVADIDVALSNDEQSPPVNLLDLEAEENDDVKHSDNDNVADVAFDEDLDTYESSFIDDGDLHERDDNDNDNDKGATADASHPMDEDTSTAGSNSVDMDDEDDVPLARPSRKSTSAKRNTVLSDDDDGSPSKKQRVDDDVVRGTHPLDRGSQLHDIWFGLAAFLVETNKLNQWTVWRREQIMSNKKMLEVSGTNLEAAFLVQYNEFSYIVESNLLPAYSSWVKESMAHAVATSDGWLSLTSASRAKMMKTTIVKSSHKPSKRASSPSKLTASSTENRIAPHTPTRVRSGKTAAHSNTKSPSTPKTPTTQRAAKVANLTIDMEECREWLKDVMATDTEAPTLPGVRMKSLSDPRFEFLPSGGQTMTTKFADDVLRNDHFRLSDRARLKLTVLLCTPTFGPWLYNLALVPSKALCTVTDPSGSAGNLVLHRHLSNPPKSHHLVGCIMFGIAAAQSTLIAPQLTKTDNPMNSKSITMWPINEHFSRMVSLANIWFKQNPLKIALYQMELSYRTRMVAPNGKPVRGTRFVPLQGHVAPSVNNKQMPDYLNKTQLNAVKDETPIYDATTYFTGNKTQHRFAFGEHDVKCPRLTREIRQGEFIAIIHSTSTYSTGAYGGTVLTFNVYYVVLLASPR